MLAAKAGWEAVINENACTEPEGSQLADSWAGRAARIGVCKVCTHNGRPRGAYFFEGVENAPKRRVEGGGDTRGRANTDPFTLIFRQSELEKAFQPKPVRT
eukprot:scaffold72449_cov30-Tisochrysis_lutea.AAC.2